ncbi:MAG: SRPBCC family protein [Aureliella sp.]
MYESKTRLPHLLKPADYWDTDTADREDRLFECTWHAVASLDELSKPGDFVTRQVAGKRIQVRNFAGELRALSNVCAHRHSLICSAAAGNTPTMRCEYHGWEYQADGATGRIPAPKNFVPFCRETMRLDTYQVDTAGQLVFVCLSPSGPSLEVFLGQEFYERLCDRFGEVWQRTLSWDTAFSANWKVPVENSLEAYHVPSVHASTFRDDPGPERSEHGLEPAHTWLKTQLPFSPHSRLDLAFQRLESRFMQWMGIAPTGDYEQHHHMPNLLFSFTDAISLSNCVIATSPTTSVSIIRQFGRQPVSSGFFQKRLLARVWGKLTAAITKRIIAEDVAMYANIQAGLESSSHSGVLGCCEERIHRFQEYLVSKADQNG